MRHCPWIIAVFVFVSIGSLPRQRGADAAPATSSAFTTLELRISPFVDLYFLARGAAADADAPRASIAGFERVIEAISQVEKALGGGRGWLVFDGFVNGCESAADFRRIAGELPETIAMIGGSVKVRQQAIHLAEALADVEEGFLEDLWPQRKAALEQARTQLQAGLLAKWPQVLEYHLASLAMEDPKDTVPVYLTADGPAPGALTSRRQSGGGVCFIALTAARGTAFDETVLHEATHALDLATREQNHALNRLRRALVAAGAGPRDRLNHDAWHTIMFIQCGETVRRRLNPDHLHYGDAMGYYAKMPRLAPIARVIWIEYLDGKITLDQAVQRITSDLTAGR